VQAELRQQFGLDDSLVRQRVDFAGDALRLDFGTSYTTREPVAR
jgi:ABC-type dipeptide/oligopeptide/nickel transport system permease component